MRAALLALALLAPFAAAAEDVGGQDLTAPPRAEAEALPVALTGALAKAKLTGRLTLGYREAAFPFSYVSEGKPMGYSLDLCRGVVEAIARELQVAVEPAMTPVTANDRFEAVASGKVDLECGSTTETVERRKQAAFSPLIFVAGVKLMVPAGSALRSLREASAVAVVSGATAQGALKAMKERYNLGLSLVIAPGYDEAFDMVERGEAQALAADDVLLTGLIARRKAGGAMRLLADYLTYEPYGLMFRKDDPQMAAAVARAFAGMAAGGALNRAYRDWFLNPTPTGEIVGLPMSAQLAEAFRAMGARDF